MYRYDFLKRDIPYSAVIFKDGDYVVAHLYESGREIYDIDFSKVMLDVKNFVVEGSRIFIKNGDYYLGQSLVFDKSLTIVSDNARLIPTGGFDTIVIADNKVVNLEGLNIYGKNGYCLRVGILTLPMVIHRCAFAYGYGVLLEGSEHVTFKHCVFRDSASDYNLVKLLTKSGYMANFNAFKRCKIYNAGDYAFIINGGQKNIIEKCEFTSNPIAIAILGSNDNYNEIIDNWFEAQTSVYHVRIDMGKGNIVKHNLFSASQYLNLQYPLILGASAQFIGQVSETIIYGNYFATKDSTTVVKDIWVRGVATKTDIFHNVIQKGILDEGVLTRIYENIGYDTNTLNATGLSVAVGVNGAYGTAKAIKSLSGLITYPRVKITWGGTFGTGETVTVKVEAVYSDGTTAYVEKSATAVGSLWLSDDDILTLIANGKDIVQLNVYAKTNLASTTVTVTVDAYGKA
jgi:hypothetical protein